VINAIYESARIRRSVQIEPIRKPTRPEPEMEIKRPPIENAAPV